MSHVMQVILLMGVTVFAVRSVAFIFANYISLPNFVKDALELLPPAILTVIIASGVLVNPTTAKLDISFTNYALVAILITLLISSKVKNFFAVIASGYAVYFLLSQFIG